MNNDFYKTLNSIALLVGVSVSALGFVVVIGWNVQSTSLVQLRPSFAPMQYNAAICLVLCGIGFLAVMYGYRRIATVIGILVTIVCSLTLSQYLFGYNLGLDTFLIKPFTDAQTTNLGRMSPTTATCFILMGFSLIVAGTKRGLMGLTSLFGAMLCAIGVTVVLGYAVDLPTAYWWGQATRMAAHTAGAFVLLGVGLLCFWRRYSKENNVSSRWTVASVGIASLLVVLGLWQAIGAQRESDLARDYDLAIANARDNVSTRLDSRTKALERMASRWNVRGGTPQPEWEADAKAYIHDYLGVQTLVWADSSPSIKWVVSDDADSAVDDAKLITEVHLRKAAQVARDGNQIYFAPIFDIADRNEDQMIFIPVYRNKEYDGEIICFLRIKDFLDTVLQLNSLNEYSITIYDGDRLIYTNEKNARAARQQAVREAQIKLDGANWTIYLAPGSKQIAATRNVIPTSILVAGLLITLLLIWTTYQTLRSRRHAEEAADLNIELANQVAERNLSEKILEANEELLKDFITHAPAAIAMLDTEMRYLQVSDQWLEDYNLFGQHIIGKSHYEVFPDIPERWKEIHRRVLTGAFTNCAEDPFLRADGTIEWLQWEARPWRKAGNEIGGLIFFTQVITKRKHADRQLRESEERFRQAFGEAPIGIALVAPDGRWLKVNRALCKLVGYSEEELLRSNFQTITHPDDLETDVSFVNQMLAGEISTYKMEKRYFHKQGHVVFILLTVSLVRNQEGSPLYFIAQIEDISERKLAEEELEKSRNKLQAVLDANKRIMAQSLDVICTIDGEGKFVQVSSACKKIWQYAPEELVGRRYIEFVHPDDHEKTNLVAAGIMAGKAVLDFENRYIRKDGSVVPLVWSAYWSPDDEIMYNVARDNTERKRTDEELRSSKARFAGILDIAEDAIISIDRDHKITIFNKGAERIFGYTAQEVIDKPLELLLPERFARNHSQNVNGFASSPDGSRRMADRREIFGRRKNGTEFPTEISISKLKLDDEIIFTSIVRDITERKKMEEELRAAHDAALEAVQMKSEFLANMSHEIRTPMNGIIGMTELMMDTQVDETQNKYVNTIKSSGESLLTIIDDILDFSKIEAGMLNFETIDFNLRSTVEGVIEMLAERAHGKELETAVFFHPNVPTQLCGDPTRLRQILTNLVGNAIKFTEWGEVVVRVSKQSEDDERAVIRFDVKDTGIGISEDAQKILFKPFLQADGSMTRRFGGTGLGLAISKQLVELMGGSISINSTPGHGSTFTFTATFIKQASQIVEPLPENVNLKGVRILVVDDNQTNRQILVQHTSAWGMIAEEAENGATALEKLRYAAANGKPFQLAVLDQKMPDMDGTELAKLVKADSAIADTRLVLMPSYSKRGQSKIARDAGISAYFTKPVRQCQLLDCLSAVMSDMSDKPEGKTATKKFITQHSIKEMKASLNQYLLLVEDNEINQTVMLGQLGKLGYRIDIAGNGHEALAALERRSYDAILMDCQMPLMDGYETTAEIRRREGKTKHTPVIAITAHAMKGDREKCLAAGMDDYISKPVKKDVLKAILDNLFENGVTTSRNVEEEIGTEAEKDSSPVDVERMMDAVSNSYERLRQLTDLYTRHTTDRLNELRTAINQNAANDVYQVAHKCLGSSSTLGMTAIVPFMKELERIGRAGDLKGAENQINMAQTEFERIKIFLDDFILQAPK